MVGNSIVRLPSLGSVVPVLKDHPFSNEKNDLIRRVASLEGGNLVVFFNLNVSEIWPKKRDSFSWGKKGGN